jgi:hypothetical protein
MITCHLRYIIDPHKLPEFEAYARLRLSNAHFPQVRSP